LQAAAPILSARRFHRRFPDGAAQHEEAGWKQLETGQQDAILPH